MFAAHEVRIDQEAVAQGLVREEHENCVESGATESFIVVYRVPEPEHRVLCDVAVGLAEQRHHLESSADAVVAESREEDRDRVG